MVVGRSAPVSLPAPGDGLHIRPGVERNVGSRVVAGKSAAQSAIIFPKFVSTLAGESRKARQARVDQSRS